MIEYGVREAVRRALCASASVRRNSLRSPAERLADDFETDFLRSVADRPISLSTTAAAKSRHQRTVYRHVYWMVPKFISIFCELWLVLSAPLRLNYHKIRGNEVRDCPRFS
jgi:hypothetical protein